MQAPSYSSLSTKQRNCVALEVPDGILDSHSIDLFISLRTKIKSERVDILIIDFRDAELVTQNVLVDYFECEFESRLHIHLLFNYEVARNYGALLRQPDCILIEYHSLAAVL